LYDYVANEKNPNKDANTIKWKKQMTCTSKSIEKRNAKTQ